MNSTEKVGLLFLGLVALVTKKTTGLSDQESMEQAEENQFNVEEDGKK